MSIKKYYKKILKSFVTVSLIVAFLMPASLAFMPREAEAQAQAAIPATACLAKYAIAYALSVAENTAAAIFSVPIGDNGAKSSNAEESGTGLSNFWRDCIEQGVALGIGKYLLAQMTDSIVQWINGGFNGEPFFVTNPGQFFLDVGDQILGDMILGSDLAFLCSPFKVHIQLALTLNFSNKYNAEYSQKSKCTLSDVVNNMEKFYEDFEEGGWEGWLSLTQSPKNNIYGSYLDAAAEAQVRIGNKVLTKKLELDWGGGFLSQEVCEEVAEGDLNNPDALGPGAEMDDGGTAEYMVGKKNCRIVTPGQTIAGVLDKQLGVPADQLGLADNLDKIFNALADQVFQQFLAGAEGLLGSKKDSSGNSSNKGWLDDLKRQAQEASRKGADAENQIGSYASTTGSGTSTQQTPNPSPQQNVAMQTIPTGTQGTSGHTLIKLTDGSTSSFGDTYNGYQSIQKPNPWVQINIGSMINLGKIQIYQRTNTERNSNLTFTVSILDSNSAEVWRDLTVYEEDFRTTYEILVPNITGQYVKIQANGTGQFHLEEVKVFPSGQPATVATTTQNGG